MFSFNRLYLQNVPKYPRRVLTMETKWPKAWTCGNPYTQTIILETQTQSQVLLELRSWAPRPSLRSSLVSCLVFQPAPPHETTCSPATSAALCLLCLMRSSSLLSPCGLSVKCPPQVHMFEHLDPASGIVWEGYGVLNKALLEGSFVRMSQRKKNNYYVDITLSRPFKHL